ncbi:MAG: hypothetical protein ISQ65_07915 [Pseudomonadales bacterium]|nr:hypothetical protein [Pseudomonadales bacterium]
MTHPSQLQLMMYAESGLHPEEDAADIAAISSHLASCKNCSSHLATLQSEAQNLRRALALNADAQVLQAPQPTRFRRTHPLRDLTLATLLASLLTGLVQWSWRALFEELVLSAVAWGTETWTPSTYALANRMFLFFQEKGAVMLNNYLALIIALLGVLALFSLRSFWRKPGIFPALLITVTGSVSLFGMAPPSHALEVIHQEDAVVIDASEIINDTLIVAAQDVTVHGTIEGNLFVAAEIVTVTGNVAGTLIAFAEDILVTGNVGGMTVTAGDSVEFEAAMLDGDLWLAGDSIELDRDTMANGNLVSGSSSLDIAGSVAKDLLAGAERVSISGQVGEDVELSARRVTVTDSAQIGGDLSYRIPSKDELKLGVNAVIQGEVDYKGKPDNFQARNPLAHHDFYLWGVLWFLAAFLVGWLTLTALPQLAQVKLDGGKDGLKTAGIGFLTLVSIPVIAIVIAITIVGLPLAFLAIGGWLAVWYLSKIIVAYLIGRTIFEWRGVSPNLLWSLLVGLLIVTATINIPLIGTPINLVFTILGMGLIAQLWLNRSSSSRDLTKNA